MIYRLSSTNTYKISDLQIVEPIPVDSFTVDLNLVDLILLDLKTVELNLSVQYGVGIIPVDINTVDIILVDLNTVEVNPASNIYCRPYSFRPYY